MKQRPFRTGKVDLASLAGFKREAVPETEDSKAFRLLQSIPNGLSFVRLGLGLCFPLIPDAGRLWVIAAAGLSDLLDGALARWLGCETETGRLLDPIADKTFVLMLVLTLLAEQVIPLAWAAGLAIRDLVVMAGVAGLALGRQWQRFKQLKPTWLGKVTTAAQFAVLLSAVLQGSVPVWALVTASALSAIAAVDYVLVFRRRIRAESS